MSLWICTQCHSPQGFSKDMACFACGGPLEIRVYDAPWVGPLMGEPIEQDIVKMIQLLEKDKMAVVKDWIREAAYQIWLVSWQHEGIVPPDGRIASMIEEHCPFQKDVAYMPVPRCDSCENYIHMDHHGPNDGYCDTIEAHVTGDFGCVKWEAKS